MVYLGFAFGVECCSALAADVDAFESSFGFISGSDSEFVSMFTHF